MNNLSIRYIIILIIMLLALPQAEAQIRIVNGKVYQRDSGEIDTVKIETANIAVEEEPCYRCNDFAIRFEMYSGIFCTFNAVLFPYLNMYCSIGVIGFAMKESKIYKLEPVLAGGLRTYISPHRKWTCFVDMRIAGNDFDNVFSFTCLLGASFRRWDIGSGVNISNLTGHTTCIPSLSLGYNLCIKNRNRLRYP